jgi:hypothetical protein
MTFGNHRILRLTVQFRQLIIRDVINVVNGVVVQYPRVILNINGGVRLGGVYERQPDGDEKE